MKKILCIIDSMGAAGAQRQMNCLAKSLFDNNYSVSVIYWVALKNNSFLVDDLRSKGIPCELHEELQMKCTRLYKLHKLIKERNPDVVISYYSAVSELLCVDHVFNKSYKLIVSERTITREISQRVKLKMRLFSKADYVVPNSTTEGKFIVNNFNFLKNKVEVIHNYVDIIRFSPKEVDQKKYSPINAIFVGRFNKAKNIPLFLKAIAIVKNNRVPFHVDFFGNAQDVSLYNQCIGMVADLDISDYVTFYPAEKRIEDEYNTHNLFVMSSAWEGFPNVLCEAMSCGLPVVCSNVSDVPCIMQDGVNGFLFDSKSVNDLAEKIMQYAELSDDQKCLMAKNSRKLIEQKFSVESFIHNYTRIIES